MKAFDVTVAGELNLDLILYGLPAVLMRDREHLADKLVLTLGSSSAIFAHNLSALGNKVGFISRVGGDPLGQIAIDRLAERGVDLSKLRRLSGPVSTGLSVILTSGSSRSILTYPGTMHEMCFQDLDLDYLSDSKHFHLSSFFLHKALRPQIPELFRRMKQNGLTTSLDTNGDPEGRWADELWETLKYVDVFLPNDFEAREIARTENLETAIATLGERVPLVAVKMGAKGAVALRGGKGVQVPSIKLEVVDSVGAGDSFDAGFLHQYLAGASLETCLSFGNLCGAFSTTCSGGTEAFRDPIRIEQFMGRYRRDQVER